MTPTRPFAAFHETQLWRAIEAAVTELQETHEISVSTAPDYVIGYLCQELVARGMVTPAALGDAP